MNLRYYYVLPQEQNSFVKEELFFINQGGLRMPWGKDWIKVKARSVDHAREIADKMYKGKV